MNGSLLAIALAASATYSYAADPFCETGRVHPIDMQFERDMEQSGGVTVEMRSAQSRAYESWDRELNQVYGELLALLSAEEKERLREAQRSWLSFRDKEAELWLSESLSGGGTLQPVIVSGYAIAMLRARVCQLSKYKEAASPR